MAGTVFPPQQAPWGKLLYAVRGVATVDVAGRVFLSPPAYAIWIPPGIPHHSRTPQATLYASLYVRADCCHDLPRAPATLQLRPLLRAIMQDLADRGVTKPVSGADRRLVRVLLDQLRTAPRHESYLPSSDDPGLGAVLAALQAAPGDRRSMAEWARVQGMTERTLARRCTRDLGMSFDEWRQRLRLLTALPMLEDGTPVHVVALSLGYSTPSAFIAMVRNRTGQSPGRLLVSSGHLSGFPVRGRPSARTVSHPGRRQLGPGDRNGR